MKILYPQRLFSMTLPKIKQIIDSKQNGMTHLFFRLYFWLFIIPILGDVSTFCQISILPICRFLRNFDVFSSIFDFGRNFDFGHNFDFLANFDFGRNFDFLPNFDFGRNFDFFLPNFYFGRNLNKVFDFLPNCDYWPKRWFWLNFNCRQELKFLAKYWLLTKSRFLTRISFLGENLNFC